MSKITVKIGEVFARIEVGDCNEEERIDLQRHISDCPRCAALFFSRKPARKLS